MRLPDILGCVRRLGLSDFPSSFFAAVDPDLRHSWRVAQISLVIAVAFVAWLVLQWWLFEADDHEEAASGRSPR
jgi:hypothetical protein